MAFFTEQSKDEVLGRTDIVDLIGSFVSLKRSGSGYVGLCPFHNEKTPSFSVSPRLQIYKCFGCGKSGNAITFMMEYDSMSYREAVEYLADRAGIKLEYTDKGGDSALRMKQTNFENSIRAALFEAGKYYFSKLRSPEGGPGRKYFGDRELKAETCNHFGLGYTGRSDGSLYKLLKGKGFDDQVLSNTGLFKYEGNRVLEIFWNRVMFPIMDRQNRIIGFGGRVMAADVKPKYVNSPETPIFHKRENLFALNYAQSSREGYLILCEGYMDVIALHQAGFTMAVASLGTALTEQHAELIKRMKIGKVYLTYDSDDAGVNATMRAIPILRNAGISSRIIDMNPYKDPDEFIKALGADAFKERIRNATNGFVFQCAHIKARYDLNDPDDENSFKSDVIQIIAEISDRNLSDSYIDAFAREYGYDREDIKQAVIRSHSEYESMMARRQHNEEIRKTTSEARNNSKKASISGNEKAYGLILSAVARRPDTYARVRKNIDPDCFLDKDYRLLAQMIFDQIEKNGKADAARIISDYEDKNDQNKIASIILTEPDFEVNEKEASEILSDCIRKVRLDYVTFKLKNPEKLSKEQLIAFINERTRLTGSGGRR